MIWKKCLLQKLTDQTEDALGNLTGGTWATRAETVARYTPWTEEQIDIEGREVTRNEQRFLVPIPYVQFPKDVTHAVIGSVRQEIQQKIDLSPRFTLLQVKVYKE